MEDISIDNTVVCLLTMHFKNIKLLDKNSELDEIRDQLRLKVSICDQITYVKIKESTILNCVHHLHIQLPNNPEDYSNMLVLQLVLTSLLVPDYDTLLGESCVHVHQIAIESPFMASCTLTKDRNTIAEVSLDCSLNYGIFGYGESPQIHGSHSEEHLHWTTFPRLTPPADLSNNQGLRIMPNDSVKHPAFIPFQQKGTKTGNRLLYPQPVKTFAAKMNNLKKWQLQCSVIRDRSKKIQFIEGLLKNSPANKQPIFKPGITSRSTIQH